MAGTFYPADPERLRRVVEAFVAAAPQFDGPGSAALIVPHAGYEYSGPVAAAAYAALDLVQRIVLVGPAHFVSCDGLALPGVEAMRTPLGDVSIDGDMEAEVRRLPIVTVDAGVHAPEHSLEVQLPFLQVALGEFSVLPLLTGAVGYQDVAGVIAPFLGAEDTVVVVSSDLSHYLDYETARILDEETASLIESLRPEALGVDVACGLTGIQAVLAAARDAGLSVRRLDLRNSGDTAGDRDRVVGYGAFAVG